MPDASMSGLHPVDLLFGRLSEVAPYPEALGVLPVPERIRGTAFFPGGSGLWGARPDTPLPAMPTGGVMILGQDFHSESGYRRSLAAGSESLSSPTWRNLLPVLTGAGIAPEQCFFTNAYMGLRAGNRATGRFPGARDPDFVERCRRFLGVQIQAQRPRLVVTLGMHAPAMLAPLSAQLTAWRGAANLAAIDSAWASVVIGARFDSASDRDAVVVALTHPSQRRLNVGRRLYRGVNGDAAEALMLEEAVRAASIAV